MNVKTDKNNHFRGDWMDKNAFFAAYNLGEEDLILSQQISLKEESIT